MARDDFDLADARLAARLEAESIAEAEAEISEAQYRALHNRIEDYTRWLIDNDYMARNAIGVPMPGERSSFDEYLFEHVEAYLDSRTASEPEGLVAQIIRPDMDDSADSLGGGREAS